MRVALVHDYLSQDGGAERVLMALHALWPDAPVFTLFYDRERAHPIFRTWDIRPTFLQRIPGMFRQYRLALPLMPAAVESMDLTEYDLVISSSSSFAKGVMTAPGAVHVCYCHTPTRFLWLGSHQYVDDLRMPWLFRAALYPLLTSLRQWDHAVTGRVDAFVANSETVAARIQKYYGREAVVVHPPVSAPAVMPPRAADGGSYFLAGGRLVPYKRFDLLVQTCTTLGLPLRIFGHGPEERRLRRAAGPTVRFLGKIADDEKWKQYAGAKAFLHPHVEDFGMTVVEAMLAGLPVIAYGKGGAAETVVPGVTGVLLAEQTWEHLAHALVLFDAKAFDPVRIRAHAERFSSEAFSRAFQSAVDHALASRRAISPTYGA